MKANTAWFFRPDRFQHRDTVASLHGSEWFAVRHGKWLGPFGTFTEAMRAADRMLDKARAREAGR